MKAKPFIRISVLCLAFLLLFLLTACGSSDGMSAYVDPEQGFDSSVTTDERLDDGLSEKKIIRTANVIAQSKNYTEDHAGLRALVTSLGGYTESSEESISAKDTHRFFATLRIPAEQLDTFLARAGETVHITSCGVETSDVTAEYYDVEARLATLNAEKTALDSLLASAATTAELLQIHERLYDVMEEIDSLTARLNVYRDEVAMSTVTISLNEVAELTEAESYGTRLGNAFQSGIAAFGNFFAEFFLWLVRALPVLLLLGAIGVGVFFFVRHQNRKHRPDPIDHDSKTDR